MIALLLLVSNLSAQGGNGNITAGGGVGTLILPSYKCKLVARQVDCNTCSFKRCTDGKMQWDENDGICTAMACAPKKVPYKAEDWK